MNAIKIPYNKFRYIYPPRPELALDSSNLPDYESKGYLWQPKLNGDSLLIFTNGIETHVYNRHKKNFKKEIKLESSFHKLHRETITDEKGSATNKWMVLVGEYMIKSKRNEQDLVWNNKFVIFDILVFDGFQLLGWTFRQRMELLDRLYGKDDMVLTPDGVETLKFLYTTPIEDVFRVKTFEDCIPKLWKDLIKIDMYEGLVGKRADAPLENGTTERNNTASQVKFRKPTKNYKF